tara:strand:+ start:30 stop:1190 length:1161 start_codon:yes stop_codon:yes gene_type:complete
MSETDQRPIIGRKEQIGFIGLLLSAFSAPFTMAFLIGAIADEFTNTTRGEIGTIATLELFSISILSIIISRNIHRINIKLVFTLGVLVIALGHSITIYSPNLETVYLARIISGFGSGAVVATIMANVAKAQNAQMTFALINSGVGAAGVLLSLIIPRVISEYGMDGAYLVHLIFSLFGFIFLLLISSKRNEEDKNKSVKIYKSKLGWIAMFGVAFAFFAHGGLLTFSERIGADLSISVITMGNVFAFGGLLTIFGPLISGIIGGKYGSMKPSVLFLTMMIISSFFVANAWSSIIFFIFVPIFGLLPIMWTPFFLGGMSNLDSSGKLAAAHPAFVTMGGAIGPMVMGYISDYGGFTLVGWVAMIVIMISIPMVVAGTNQADKAIQNI